MEGFSIYSSLSDLEKPAAKSTERFIFHCFFCQQHIGNANGKNLIRPAYFPLRFTQSDKLVVKNKKWKSTIGTG
jgi:hypothetical protein